MSNFIIAVGGSRGPDMKKIEQLKQSVIESNNILPYINLNEKNEYKGWVTDFHIQFLDGSKMELNLTKEEDLFLLFVLAGMLCLGCGSESAATLSEPELVDAQGTKVPVVLSPQRILTFTSGTDEIVLGLVSPRKMAGINEDLANPSRSNVATLAKQISVRLPRHPSIEAVAALRPDLVFVQSWIEAEKIEALRSLGILVVVCRTPANLEDVKFNIRLIAYATGEREQGEKLIGKMQHKITQITQQVEALPAEEKQRSIALISIMGGYGGSGCTFDEMCKYAGASNAKAGAGNQNGQVMSKEQLVQLNPDYLFLPVYENAEERENAYGA